MTASERVTEISRRRFLRDLGFIAAAGLWPAGVSPAHATVGPSRTWTEQTSANGWPIPTQSSGVLAPNLIEGSDASVVLRRGDVATIMRHVARRLHYELRPLAHDDITGYRTSRAIATAYESNYLSGTAFAIHPGRYPVGARSCFFPHEMVIVRDILAECHGIVRWGGDDRTAPMEGHFQVDVPPSNPALRRVADQITQWAAQPGQGAGAPPDPTEPARRHAAQRLAYRQRSTA